MSKNLAFKQALRKRGAMHCNKRGSRTRAHLMDCLRDQLLAGAAFPLNQDGRTRRRDQAHAADHALKRRRVAHDSLDVELFVQAFVQLLDLDLERLALQRALHKDLQALDIHGLGQKVDCTTLHRLHRRIDVAVCGHHDHSGLVRH